MEKCGDCENFHVYTFCDNCGTCWLNNKVTRRQSEACEDFDRRGCLDGKN